MLSSSAQSRGKYKEVKPLHGVPANIYILRNSGLKEGVLQIGLSRRSGWAKALELNRDKTNTIPGSFECVFELRAQDGGGAIEKILKALHHMRCGRRDQDFFQIELHQAEAIVRIAVRDADSQFQNRFRQDVAMREYMEKEAPVLPKAEPVREGIFKKAISWVSEAMN